MVENFFIVGRWDGSNIWSQWDAGARPNNPWRVRLVVDGKELPPRVCQKDWFRQSLNAAAGARVEAQMQVGEDWVAATEARFARSVCRFEFRSDRTDLHYVEGTNFFRAVDGAPCAYRLVEELALAAGQKIEVDMEAVAINGWAHLDLPGDFLLRPALGVSIRNLDPSSNNLEPTGRDYTILEAGFSPDNPAVLFAVSKPAIVR